MKSAPDFDVDKVQRARRLLRDAMGRLGGLAELAKVAAPLLQAAERLRLALGPAATALLLTLAGSLAAALLVDAFTRGGATRLILTTPEGTALALRPPAAVAWMRYGPQGAGLLVGNGHDEAFLAPGLRGQPEPPPSLRAAAPGERLADRLAAASTAEIGQQGLREAQLGALGVVWAASVDRRFGLHRTAYGSSRDIFGPHRPAVGWHGGLAVRGDTLGRSAPSNLASPPYESLDDVRRAIAGVDLLAVRSSLTAILPTALRPNAGGAPADANSGITQRLAEITAAWASPRRPYLIVGDASGVVGRHEWPELPGRAHASATWQLRLPSGLAVAHVAGGYEHRGMRNAAAADVEGNVYLILVMPDAEPVVLPVRPLPEWRAEEPPDASAIRSLRLAEDGATVAVLTAAGRLQLAPFPDTASFGPLAAAVLRMSTLLERSPQTPHRLWIKLAPESRPGPVLPAPDWEEIDRVAGGLTKRLRSILQSDASNPGFITELLPMAEVRRLVDRLSELQDAAASSTSVVVTALPETLDLRPLPAAGPCAAPIAAFEMDAAGRRFALGGTDGFIRLAEVSAFGEPVVERGGLPGHAAPVTGLAEAGREFDLLASIGADGGVRVSRRSAASLLPRFLQGRGCAEPPKPVHSRITVPLSDPQPRPQTSAQQVGPEPVEDPVLPEAKDFAARTPEARRREAEIIRVFPQVANARDLARMRALLTPAVLEAARRSNPDGPGRAFSLQPAENVGRAIRRNEIRFCTETLRPAATLLRDAIAASPAPLAFEPVFIGRLPGCAGAVANALEVWLEGEGPPPRTAPARAQ